MRGIIWNPLVLPVSIEMVEKICLALGCTADDVLDFIPDSPDNGTADNVE